MFYDPKRSKASDSIISFLCAALLSPLTLFTGRRLYGPDAQVEAHHLVMVSWVQLLSKSSVLIYRQLWKYTAHLQSMKPKWVRDFEFNATEALMTMVFGDYESDTLAVLQKLARTVHANMPDPDEAGFFRKRLTAKEIRQVHSADGESFCWSGPSLVISVYRSVLTYDEIYSSLIRAACCERCDK